ncbi:MAG: hypothetical protein AAB617_02155 [Patescibacteria group bacterium]
MQYAKLYFKFLNRQAALKRPLRVIFDCSNGPAGLVLKNLKIKNIKATIINSRIDGRFPAHGPNPLVKMATNQCAKEVRSRKADLGAVFDGDADRVMFIDDLGRRIPVHVITYLLSLKTPPPYVADLYISRTLTHLNLLKTVDSKVGAYYMKKTMKRVRASFGAEFSGHYYFKEMGNADSGVLATIKVANALSGLPYKISQFYDSLPEFYFEQWNIGIKHKERVEKKIKSKASKDLFLIVRSSNTEPATRFFLGSRNKKIFQKELKRLQKIQ